MLDQVPSLGYIPKVFKAMSSRNEAIPKSAIDLAHVFATSEVCGIIQGRSLGGFFARLPSRE